MKITLNGAAFETECKTLFELRDSNFSSECIAILNGFQSTEDISINDGDTVSIIKKGVMPSFDELESLMAARHTPAVHESVKKARVAVCGLGGLGSNIAVMLARTGVGYLRLIDFDIVEPSNLNRQNYYVKHLGMFKTDALIEQIKDINPFIKVECKTARITYENAVKLLDGCDYICEAFDNPEAKAMLAEVFLSELSGKKLVCGSGMAGFDSSNEIVTKRVAENFYMCGDGVNGARPGRGLMAPRVSVCAGHQANMILRLIMGIEEV